VSRIHHPEFSGAGWITVQYCLERRDEQIGQSLDALFLDPVLGDPLAIKIER
jgi:hypothetical protein